MVFAIAVAAVLLRRWQQMGPYATGPDPGNWLAYGRQLFGGPGKSTGGIYPPLVPFAMHCAGWLFGPMVAAKVVGLGALAAVMAAAFFVASGAVGRWLALAAAICVGLAGGVTEAVAFGGYPQNYTFAFLLLAAAAFAGYLRSPSRRSAAVGAIALSGAALSHHVYYLLACLVVGFVWLLWLTTRPDRRHALHNTTVLVCAVLPSALLFLPTFVLLRHSGYSAPLAASATDAPTALAHAIDEARWLWMPAIATGAVFLLLTCTTAARSRPLWQVAAALLLVGFALLLATGEVRIAPLLLGGAVLSSALALAALPALVRGLPITRVPPVIAVAFVVALCPFADGYASQQFQYYRVADPSLVDAARWVATHEGSGAVAVQEDGRGWPRGWWFEGLTRARVVVGSNARWLAYPREKRNAALAERLFDPRAGAADVRAAAKDAGIGYLVYSKDWAGRPPWSEGPSPPMSVVFENASLLILEVPSGR